MALLPWKTAAILQFRGHVMKRGERVPGYQAKSDAPRIRVADRYLDEVSIGLEPAPGVSSQIRFPAHNHSLRQAGGGLVLRTPPIVALQLLFEGVLGTQEAPKIVPVQFDGKDLGCYALTGIEHPRNPADTRLAVVRLKKVDAAP